MHPEMILAIPYFSLASQNIPICVAYMPISQIKVNSRGYRCAPAKYSESQPMPRPKFIKFFDAAGIGLLEKANWKDTEI
jgi:hypothetical protein